jgi:ribosomal protein S19E (S16A)
LEIDDFRRKQFRGRIGCVGRAVLRAVEKLGAILLVAIKAAGRSLRRTGLRQIDGHRRP